MGDVKTRRMVPSDGAVVAKLSQELGYDVSLRDASVRIGEMETDSLAVAYVATVENEVVGWIQAHDRRLVQYPRVLEISGLAVAGSARGHGIGSALVEAVSHWGRSRGHDRLFVRSNVTRDAAHQFYESVGFTREKTSHTFVKAIEKV